MSSENPTDFDDSSWSNLRAPVRSNAELFMRWNPYEQDPYYPDPYAP